MKIITAFVLSTSLFLANVQAQERPLPAFPSITITGEAKHEVPPDFAKLTVTISSNDEKNDKALLFHDQKLKKFMQVVDSLDKKQAEVDSSNFSLYQQKESVNIELAKLTKNFIPPKLNIMLLHKLSLKFIKLLF